VRCGAYLSSAAAIVGTVLRSDLHLAKGMSYRDGLMLPQSFPNIHRRALLTLVLITCATAFSSSGKVDHHRGEQILGMVSKDVRDNFYDRDLKGLDWSGLTEQARQRIQGAKTLGEMNGAISALLFQLHDSHTVFIPQKSNIKQNTVLKPSLLLMTYLSTNSTKTDRLRRPDCN
jgi:hypothetical protein